MDSTKTILLTALMCGLLATPALAAGERKPTAREVAAARGECAKHRRKVERLEADQKTDPNLLEKERSDWERSCARAEILMQDAGMEKRSPPPPASPPPPPTLIIDDSPAPRDKPIIIDEPSAPPTTDSKPQLQLSSASGAAARVPRPIHRPAARPRRGSRRRTGCCSAGHR